MVRGWHFTLGAVLAGACALPAVEVDENLGAAGSGGTGGASGGTGGAQAGTGGKGGIGKGGMGGDSGEDPRETACFDYCNTYIDACGEHEANTYDDSLDCVVTCSTSDWPFGENIMEPNSVQCRRAHAHLAVELGLDPHCFHSAEVPSKTTCAL